MANPITLTLTLTITTSLTLTLTLTRSKAHGSKAHGSKGQGRRHEERRRAEGRPLCRMDGDHLRGRWMQTCDPRLIQRPDHFAYKRALPKAKGWCG